MAFRNRGPGRRVYSIMGMVRVGVCVMVATLVLAGCVARTGGTPERSPDSSRGRDEPVGLPTPPRAGDQLDPCSLTGPAAFESAGIARMPGKPDMVECTVSVATDEGPAVVRLSSRVWLDALPADRELVAELGRGATVERYGPDCEMVLVLAGDVGIAVTATGSYAREELLCELAEGAATGVFKVLTAGRAKFWTPEPNSLALLDACELLPAESVYRHLDARGEIHRIPTGHSCWWGGKEDWAFLWFPVAESPADAGVPDGTPSELIGGRESWMNRSCTVYTQHIEFAPGVGTFEFAALMVNTSDPCTTARTLAVQAWANLPS